MARASSALATSSDRLSMIERTMATCYALDLASRPRPA